MILTMAPSRSTSVGILVLAASIAFDNSAEAFGVRRPPLPYASSSSQKNGLPSSNDFAIANPSSSSPSMQGKNARRSVFVAGSTNFQSNSRTALQSSMDDGSSSDEQHQKQLIESWLTTHLPTLPLTDQQSYTDYLYKDGFTSLDALNSINDKVKGISTSGRVEDLYFMKKGHRRVLMKKLGIIRNMRGIEGNRLVSDRIGGDARGERAGSGVGGGGAQPMPGDGSALATASSSGTDAKKVFDDDGNELDTSIEDWLAEQNRHVEQEQMKQAPKGGTASTMSSNPSSGEGTARGIVNQNQQAGNIEDGVTSSENGGGEDPLDDFVLRYQSLDTDPASTDDARKETRRLEELKRTFLERARNSALDDDEEELRLDDLATRYQSLDIDAMDGGTKDKEVRRLEELKLEFLSARNKGMIDDEDMLDDFVSRYDSLDIDAMDRGTKDKESRRLGELKDAFLSSKNANIAEEDFLNDFESRYQLMDIEAMDSGTKNKEARRLEVTKQSFLNARKRNALEDDEEPLRLDLLKPSQDESAIERKERMRVEEFQRRARLSAEKKKSRKEQEGMKYDDAEEQEVDISAGDGKAYYKTNEERRLEELERYFNKRRAARIAEEERLELMLIDAKREAALMNEEDGEKDFDVERVNVGRSTDEGVFAEENMELDNFFDDRERKSQSLSTTMPPTGKGRKKDSSRPFTSADKEKMIDDLEAYQDITVNNMQERENQSLSTTMPPSNRGADIARLSKLEGERGSEAETEDDPEECVGDECWDITRSSFAGRTARSLATTLPPSNTKRSTSLAAASSSNNMDGDSSNNSSGNDDEPVFDITQNLFPESRGKPFRSLATPDSAARSRSPQSAFRQGEKSEMNDRRPPNSNDGNASAMSEGAAAAEEAYDDITHKSFAARSRSLATSSVFKEKEKSEMNKKRPPNTNDAGAVTSISGAAATAEESEKSEMNDRRPPDNSTPTSKVNTAEAKVKPSTAATSLIEDKNKSEVKSRASALYQRFRSERKSVFDQGERSEMNGRPQSPESLSKGPAWARKASDRTKSTVPDHQTAYLDTVSRFPENQPAMSVNTGTKKRGTTTGSHIEADKKKGGKSKHEGGGEDSYLDISKNFSADRPSMSVNTGTKKARTTSGSYQERHSRVDQAERNQDSSFADITQQPFQGDRGSFVSRVNSGTKKPQTTAGSYRESHGVGRNIAQNFSPDRASLLGHPTRMDIDRLKRSNKSNDNSNDDYLDKHSFSSDLSPHSPVRSTATGAVWRESSSAAKNDSEEYLDTPRAFVKNLDMVPSTSVKGAKKGTATRSEKMNVDSYLNKNPFSSNLRSASSASSPLGNKARSTAADLEFLDKPRAFQSNVDMVTSNTSGARFKRSSDIPPELKNTNNRDYYDIRSMSSVKEMARTKVSRKIVSSADGSQEEPYTDITRTPMSRLERTSSVIIDSNKRGKSSTNPEELSDDGDSNDDDSSYEEVMHWLLTYLPQLQEDDAIAYFKHLLEDGFDSIEMCGEVLEDDLYFMEKDHQRLLLQSLEDKDVENSSAEKEKIEDELKESSLDDSTTKEKDNNKPARGTLEDTIDSAKEELEKTEAWIAEQNQLVEERLAARLAKETKARTTVQEEEAASREHSSSSAQETSSGEEIDTQNGEPFADITRSRFVDRPSLSLAAPNSSFTRTDSSASRSRDKEQKQGESFFDITRNLFKDRPSLSAVPSTKPTSPPPPLTKKSNDVKSTPLSSRDASKEEVTKSASSESAPRAELYQLYIKRGYTTEQAQRLRDYFTTWTNDAKSHESKFTCIFTCPMTGEHFACGCWKDSGGDVEVEDGIFWYRNKKQAMNAAAAKALDSFSLRECHGTDREPRKRCKDAPNLAKDDAPCLPTLPGGISLPSKLTNSE